MNRVILMGRLTRDPDIRYTQGESSMCVARYTLAVDRRRSRRDDGSGEPTADFISCVAFGRSGEFAERYMHKGMRMLVSGRIQTGSYTNKDGNKVYTTDVVVEDQEFADSRNSGSEGSGSYEGGYSGSSSASAGSFPDGFMNVPSDLDEDLPFN